MSTRFFYAKIMENEFSEKIKEMCRLCRDKRNVQIDIKTVAAKAEPLIGPKLCTDSPFLPPNICLICFSEITRFAKFNADCAAALQKFEEDYRAQEHPRPGSTTSTASTIPIDKISFVKREAVDDEYSIVKKRRCSTPSLDSTISDSAASADRLEDVEMEPSPMEPVGPQPPSGDDDLFEGEIPLSTLSLACQYCERLFETRDQRFDHEVTAHFYTQLVCSFCSVQLESYQLLAFHLSEHHQVSDLADDVVVID